VEASGKKNHNLQITNLPKQSKKTKIITKNNTKHKIIKKDLRNPFSKKKS